MMRKYKKHRKAYKIIIIIEFLILIAVVFVIINNYTLSTTYGEYSTDEISDNIRVVLISDLHGKSFGANNSVLAKKILKQNPDIIVMSGDMFGEEGASGAIVSLTSRLSKSCKNIYYSFGNHESRDTENAEYMADVMEENGAIVLNNKSVIYRKGDNTVNIFGLMLPLYYYSGYDKSGELIYNLSVDELNKYLGKSADGFNLLIAHNPIYFEAYAQWGADMVLSGHNHGGVVRLPSIGGLASPNGDRGNVHYDCGEYKSSDSVMYLSRGLGEWAGPIRAFNLPEIYVIDILGE